MLTPEQQPLADRGDHLAVALEVGLVGRVGTEDRAQPVGDVQVDPDDGRHQQPEDEEQPDPGPQQLGEDTGEAQAVEPELLGPDAGEQREQEEQDDQHDRGHQQRAGPAAAALARSGCRSGRAGSGARRLELVAHAGSPAKQVRSGRFVGVFNVFSSFVRRGPGGSDEGGL
jgi:hypothetical protein